MNYRILLLASAMLGASLHAASAADIATLKSNGVARLAIGNEPPYTSIDSSGKVSGAGPDVARVIFERLGVKNVEGLISEYGAMIPGLQAGRFDAITAGLFMKPERCAAVAYSEPMMCDAEAMLVKKGNSKGFKSYEDVAKDPTAKIGVAGGGTEEKLALQAGVPRDRVVPVPDPQSGLKMLQDSRIEVLSYPVLSIHGLVSKANDPNLETIAPVVGAPVYCDGAAFRKQDVALRDAFDVELKKMKESGEFAKIIEPYGFSAAAAMSTTREKLCAAK